MTLIEIIYTEFWIKTWPPGICYENDYTVGLRGIHDTHMAGGVDIPAQIALLEQVFRDRGNPEQIINKEITNFRSLRSPIKRYRNITMRFARSR
jgi:hypothetical protein